MVTCNDCGREDGHFLGCAKARSALLAKVIEADAEKVPEEINPAYSLQQCEHPECSEPKKPWSGKGAKPKFCAAGHKKEKS